MTFSPCLRGRGALGTTRDFGRITEASVPAPTLLRNSKRPPCSSASPVTIGRPRPVPQSRILSASDPCPNALKTRGNLLFRNTGAVVANGQDGFAAGEDSSPNCDNAVLRREFDRIRDQVQANLPQRALIGENTRHIRLEIGDEAQLLGLRVKPQKPDAFLCDIAEIEHFFRKLVAAGLDPGKVENLIDELQEMVSGTRECHRRRTCKSRSRSGQEFRP